LNNNERIVCSQNNWDSKENIDGPFGEISEIEDGVE
jgi:hypothetical protein